MNLRYITTLVLFIICCNSLVINGASLGVMPWMGLERTQEDISSDLQQISQIKPLLGYVSYERFNLGPNSTLIINNLTDVQYTLQSQGIVTLPMISTFPWGLNRTIEWARQLISNPTPFINTCVQQALNEGFDGYNVDIEPLGGTEQDAIGYANFLNEFANALHQHNKILTVCTATYDPFWNYTLIGQTNVDKIFTMSTYAGSWTGFQNAVQYAVQTIPLDKLAVGMMTVGSNNTPFTDDQLEQRFQLLANNKVQYIGIWCAPIPTNWLPFIKAYNI